MTMTHTCPDCGKTVAQCILGGSIDKGCPECRPERWPRREL
jgi:predicted  nucleic acid-binding Zn-ribbon protein